LVHIIFTVIVSGAATGGRAISPSEYWVGKETRAVFWKIYAVFYLVIVALGMSSALGQLAHAAPIDLIDAVVVGPIGVAALWSAYYRHISLPKHSWKVLLFAAVFWRAIAAGNTLLFGDTVSKFQAQLNGVTANMPAGPAYAVVAIAWAAAGIMALFVTYPPLVAFYRNAYGYESLLQLMSPSPKRSTAEA
jgi:hypothetical protein